MTTTTGRDTRELGGAWTKYQRHDFPRPAEDVASFVDGYWVVSWTYREPYRQLIVPYPHVHLVFQDGGATVSGVASRHQTKVLHGTRSVFGVRFRPGCFRPFLGTSVSTIRDSTVDASDVFGAGLPDQPNPAAVDRFLRARLPEPDAVANRAAGIVAEIAANPGITTVAALARELGVGVRQVQRLFAEYVGIGPKWVIRRYRLHKVTERLAAGARPEWAALAADLGYADQSHLIRDFTAMFGEPPTRYARRY